MTVFFILGLFLGWIIIFLLMKVVDIYTNSHSKNKYESRIKRGDDPFLDWIGYTDTTEETKKINDKQSGDEASDVVIPEVFAIFEQKVAHLVSYDPKTERVSWDEAAIDLLRFFESIIARAVEKEGQLTTCNALIERLMDCGDALMEVIPDPEDNGIELSVVLWRQLIAEYRSMSGEK